MSESTLTELFYGKSAHANPVACVNDLSFQLAGCRTDNFPHSIWQLVTHLNYWMEYELRRIRGERPAYPENAAESWPSEPAPASEAEWNKAIVHFKDCSQNWRRSLNQHRLSWPAK